MLLNLDGFVAVDLPGYHLLNIIIRTIENGASMVKQSICCHHSIPFLAASLQAFKKTSYLPFLQSSISEYSYNMPLSTPQMAPAIWAAIAPTVSQSPPMSAFQVTASVKHLVKWTVWSAMASASMQQEPIYPGCCLNLQGEQVWFQSLQFQLRSLVLLLNFLNFLFSASWLQYSQGYLCPRAKKRTPMFSVLKLSHICRRSSFPSTSSFRLTSQTMIVAINLQHSNASVPLWVVKLWRPEQSIAFYGLLLQAIGTGASRIRDPLPLLKRSPSAVQSCCQSRNSSMEMEMLPPSPMERGRPPLLRPWCNQAMKVCLMCLGLKRQLLSRMLSAMQRPIEASSVHTPTKPCLLSSLPCMTALWISTKPCFMIWNRSFLNFMNSVHAPNASPIAMPKIAAICLETLLDGISSNTGWLFLLSFISWKILFNRILSQSLLGKTECLLSQESFI